MDFVSRSLFWGKPYPISASIEALFCSRWKGVGLLLNWAQTKLCPLHSHSESPWFVISCLSHHPGHPKHFWLSLAKRKGELQWCTLKISHWKKALQIPQTLGFYACVKIKLYFTSIELWLQLNKKYLILIQKCGYFFLVNNQVAQVMY